MSVRVAQDSACHLMGRRPCTTDVYFGLIRHALAFCQMKQNIKQQFPAGVVEWDGTRLTGTRHKEAGTKVHSGRFLVGAHRSSSSCAVFFPLPNRETKVSAPGPPETHAEVAPIIKSKMVKHKHLAASDSGTAFKKTWKEMGLEAASARHGRAEFTPLVKLSKANLASDVLQNITAKKRTSQTKRTVRIIGGDQKCESLANMMKFQLRRVNLLGKHSKKDNKHHIDGLSAVWLNSQAAFADVLSALAEYRQAMQDTCSPCQAYVSTAWLQLQDMQQEPAS